MPNTHFNKLFINIFSNSPEGELFFQFTGGAMRMKFCGLSNVCKFMIELEKSSPQSI